MRSTLFRPDKGKNELNKILKWLLEIKQAINNVSPIPCQKCEKYH